MSKIDVKVRRWKKKDIPAIVECQKRCYEDLKLDHLCDARSYEFQYKNFPEGLTLAEVDGKVVGYSTTLIVLLDDESTYYDYVELTGDGTFSTHTPSGDTLYGADMAILPKYRGKGIGKLLFNERKKLLKRMNLRRIVAGGRIPGYENFKGKLTAEEYVAQVVDGKIKDTTLTPQLRIGYSVKGVYMDYLSDERSLNYATFLEYLNPEYHPMRHAISRSIRKPMRKIRVCSAQYKMRNLSSKEEFFNQTEFFVTTANSYGCHFLLFPELFTAQLFSLMDSNINSQDAIKELCKFKDEYIELFTGYAKKTGMFIIGGSHPVLDDDGKIRNRAFLFTPQGDVHTQDKLHITPIEAAHWGIAPGHEIKVFDAGFARFAIQICYDIEFPEVSRLLTLAGVEAIFVPFSTDDRKAYYRVRHCAQARAVENYIYTILAGNIGSLTQVKAFLINYGQAAILTPSDFPFPKDAVLAEATSMDETVVIADLDLSDLAKHREVGSVRPLRDRRPDLYELKSTIPIKTIKLY